MFILFNETESRDDIDTFIFKLANMLKTDKFDELIESAKKFKESVRKKDNDED